MAKKHVLFHYHEQKKNIYINKRVEKCREVVISQRKVLSVVISV